MSNPKISIIVPVYNVERYLRQCIDSILAQTYKDFELLLIDDGSPDNSGNICDEYAQKDSRIRVFHKTNGGVSTARNMGIDNAKGEYISFIDADDELYPNAYETMMKYINDDIDIVFAGFEKYDEQGKLIYSVDKNYAAKLDADSLITTMFRPIILYYQGFIWNKLFRLSIINDNSLRFNEKIYFNEDRLFVTEYLCSMKQNGFYCTKPVYKYYIHNSSAFSPIKHSFNYKFLTDLDAWGDILALVKRHSAQNTKVVKKRIYDRSHWIRSMARKYNVADLKQIERQIDEKTNTCLSPFDIFYIKSNIIKADFKQQMKRLLKTMIGSKLRRKLKMIRGGGGEFHTNINNGGINNTIHIDKTVTGGQLNIAMYGNNNFINVSEKCILNNNNTIFMQGDNNSVNISSNVTFDQNVLLVVCEGTRVDIGEDCIFANGVTIRTSDQHAIYNNDNMRINKAKNVKIGNHVWLGAHVIVMKGTEVGDGSVIGMNSMITKNIPINCIAVGTPAKPIKHNIHWNKKL